MSRGRSNVTNWQILAGCGVAFALMFSIIGLIATIDLGLTWRTSTADSAALDAAQPCDAAVASTAVRTSRDCLAQVRTEVIQRDDTDSCTNATPAPGHGGSAVAGRCTIFQFDLDAGAAGTLVVPLSSADVASLKPGDSVTARVWRGKARTLLLSNESVVSTLDDPHRDTSDGIAAIVFGVITIICWSVIIVGIVQTRHNQPQRGRRA